MRWIASLVAEALPHPRSAAACSSIPADARPGYREGRLRLLYEANPIALPDRAGGRRGDHRRERILELSAQDACTSACR